MEHLRRRPGTLWPAILRQSEHALRGGALRPIETSRTLLEERGPRFLVRQISGFARKEETRQARKIGTGAPRGETVPSLRSRPHCGRSLVRDQINLRNEGCCVS
ncbi:hypothetical protein [Paraburkholderia sp. BL6669N2]|uniref:hypothetical protein n=1 Tax=Paraburkholderia sp. BL6669N2 TaxID=1938807 RepID=UPI0038D49ACE